MAGTERTAGPGLLLERDAELDHVDAALAAVAVGRGSLLAIRGPAGAGKTALLEAIRPDALVKDAGSWLADQPTMVHRGMFRTVLTNRR